MHARPLLYHFSFVLLSILIAPAALSEPPADGNAELKAALEMAWQRSPQARTLEARRAETTAGRESAQAWIAGSPSVGLSRRNGRWTDQPGLRETEVSVSAPIWLPGQKSARSNLAHISNDAMEAKIADLRLTLAGEVRERMWAVAATQEALKEAEDHLQHLEEFADEILQRVKAGDLARSDGILAQQEVLAAQAAVTSANMHANDALSRYALLTGKTDIPHPVAEKISPASVEPHPRISAARTALQSSQASMHLIKKSRSEAPTLGISMRREQENAIADPIRSIGLSIQIPIGTAARNRPLEAAAQTQLATASADLLQTESALHADIALARQQLAVAQRALELASSRTALTNEYEQLIEKAFRLGERGLAEILRARALAHEAENGEGQQRVAVGLAHAKLNQALGVIP